MEGRAEYVPYPQLAINDTLYGPTATEGEATEKAATSTVIPSSTRITGILPSYGVLPSATSSKYAS